MKRLIFAVFLAAIAAVTTNAQVQIDFPLLRQMGVRVPAQNFVVMNGTPFACRLVVYGNEVAVLAGGDTVYDNRRWEPLTPEVPLVALCYQNGAYVGAAAKKFYVGQNSDSLSWTIREGEILRPDGGYAYAGYGQQVYPAPIVGDGSRREKLPRKWWNATSGAQIVNNTFFTMRVLVNGRLRAEIGTGDVYYLEYRHIFGDQQSVKTIQVLFLDGGRLIGTHDISVYTTSYDVRVEQHILGPYSIRR